jgi:peptidoglycan/LPS O-acetylase OafA/YrhL
MANCARRMCVFRRTCFARWLTMPQWGIEFAERADVDIEARASRSRARYQAHDDKGRTLLLRISVVLALIGMFMDIAMGVRQNFALAPAHAHLNLLGFLMLFMAGLYYRIVPQAAEGLPGRLYAALAVIGAIAFPTGIAAVELGGRIASRHS